MLGAAAATAALLMPDMAETVGDAETDTVTTALAVVPLVDDGPDVACTPMSRVLLSMTQDVAVEEEEEEEEEVLVAGGAVAVAAAA